MTGWHPTTALARSLVVAAVGLGLALLVGDPVQVVLVTPFVALAALALAHKPTRTPRLGSRLDHTSLQEGQGTTSRLSVQGAADVEQVTRVAAPTPYVTVRPGHGQVGRLFGGTAPELELSPRRWGLRTLGEEKVGLHSRWAGYQFGPAGLPGQQVRVLPTTAPYDSRAEAPQPVGLVGAHRSRRPGSGTELAGIRPFVAGDRLRRINWRVSLRTAELHVVSTRAEEDTGVLLVLDALADHGLSQGVDGSASSLDLTVRAASAIAEHHVRTGDRVALRVVGRGREQVGYGSGRRHLRRLQDRLAVIRAGDVEALDTAPLQLGVTGGAVVIVLSPMLAPAIGTVTATLARRGVPVLVIDTLPPDATPPVGDTTARDLAALAWQMRRLERTVALEGLAGLGCPVVPWRGPGTVDEVMRRLARRAQLPRVVSR